MEKILNQHKSIQLQNLIFVNLGIQNLVKKIKKHILSTLFYLL